MSEEHLIAVTEEVWQVLNGYQNVHPGRTYDHAIRTLISHREPGGWQAIVDDYAPKEPKPSDLWQLNERVWVEAWNAEGLIVHIYNNPVLKPLEIVRADGSSQGVSHFRADEVQKLEEHRQEKIRAQDPAEEEFRREQRNLVSRREQARRIATDRRMQGSARANARVAELALIVASLAELVREDRAFHHYRKEGS